MAQHAKSLKGAAYLSEVSDKLSQARTLEDVTAITRHAAREISGADGATFVLREDNLCYYVDEEAIAPLWKGRKFPIETCVSGWSMLHEAPLVIEDIYADERVLIEAYRPTFVKSLVMVPIRDKNPLGAIGNYWATHQRASEEVVGILRSLANLVAVALENVKLLSQLRAINHELEDSLRARDEFLSIAAHELRTPLTSLKLQLQMLERETQKPGAPIPTPQDLKIVSERSLRQVDSLTRLIENLLDVSRIRLHRVKLSPAKFLLNQLIHDSIDRMAPQIRMAKCAVKLALNADVTGFWDEVRIGQVLTNLISNACKYAPGATITISLKESRGLAVLEFSDDGPGIKKENQERIFERFERESETRNVGGLGLGLFIVKNLIAAHHGKILLESDLGRGTKFTIELPIVGAVGI